MNHISSQSLFRENKNIVAIGGGHGLSSVLRGLKKYTDRITAVVTVADDGGSSGSLRRDIGMLPPGDIRSCLSALSPNEDFLSQVLQYRFSDSAGVGSHNLGNLLITALTNLTGSFEQGIQELAHILAIRGRVTPSTLEDVNLIAEVEYLSDGVSENETVFGESNITKKGGKIRSIRIEPEGVIANPEAVHAILASDLILLGPGSLFTSLMPNLLVSGISQAIKAASAPVFFISNVTTQQGETDHMNCLEHVQTICDKIPDIDISGVVCNNNYEHPIPGNSSWVKVSEPLMEKYHVFQGDLIDKDFPWRHDSDKLAAMLAVAYEECAKK